ncbi:MAG: ABC transporter permease [Vicinamibacterales bacterium]
MHRWLRWFYAPAVADAIAGDVEEERRRRARHSPWRARVWTWVALAGLAAAAVRPGGGAEPPTTPSGRSAGRLAAELRVTLRTLARSPWYAVSLSAVVGLSLALAATVFAVVDGALFAPLPYLHADRVFAVEARFTGLEPVTAGESVSVPDVAAWSAAMPDVAFAGLSTMTARLSTNGTFEDTLVVALVEPGFLDVLGVAPRVGGFPADAFDATSRVSPVLVTDTFWRARLGADPAVVGRRIDLDPSTGAAFEVAGVMPAGFVLPMSGDVGLIAPYRPTAATRADFGRRDLRLVVARLAAGTRAPDAEARLTRAMREIAPSIPPPRPIPSLTPEMARRRGPFEEASIVPLRAYVARHTRTLFAGAFAAALLLLLLATANVSALMAARGAARARDRAIRRAMGANRWQVARLVLIEAAVLVGSGALAGIALAPVLVGLATRLLPDAFVFFRPPQVDARVWAFAGAAAAVAVLFAAAGPLRAGRRGESVILNASGPATTPGLSFRARGAAIVLQVAIGFVLVVGGSLFAGSLLSVWSEPIGIDVDHLAAMEIRLLPEGPDRGAIEAARTTLAADLLARVRQVPGVAAGALTSASLFTRQVSFGGPRKAGAPIGGPAPAVQSVSPGFPGVVAPGLVEGRWFTDAELDARDPVVVVDETMARTWWPDGGAVGQTLQDITVRVPVTVIGVARPVRYYAWDIGAARIGTVYRPLVPGRTTTATLVIRSDDPRRAMAAVLAEVQQLGPAVRVGRPEVLSALAADSIRSRRLQAWIFGSFAAAGILILAAGVFGLVAMSTARRTREIGIRLALGATRVAILRGLMREQAVPIAAGLGIGIGVAAWGTGYAASYLYELRVTDYRVWGFAVATIVLVGLAGVFVPARRASRSDPAGILRAE